MAKKCDCCGKGIGFGEYPVKDGTICGKCYNKYTKAGFEYKKKLTISEIKEVISNEETLESTREFKKEDLKEATGLLYLWAAGFFIGIIVFVILWADFLGYAFAKEKRTVEAYLVDSHEIYDIEEDENGKIGSTTFAYYQYEIEGKTYEESLEVGVDKSKRNLDVYKKGNGEWEVYLKNPKRHFASLGFVLLSLFCYWMGKSDVEAVLKVLKRKKH